MTPAQQNPRNPEHDLTQTLTREADRFVEQGGGSIELDQVLSRAGEIRRGRRLRASIVMAAAVVALAVPVGITVLNDQPRGSSPGPAGQPTGAVSPSASTAAVPADAVARVPLGSSPDHSYVQSGVVHDIGGGTHQLPAGAAMDVVTPYLGGYLAADVQSNIVTQYDGTGKVVKSGPGSAQFVTTLDGIETAYVMNGTLYSNPGSGMASGDGAVGPVDATSGQPIGYLPGGLLYVKKVNASGSPVYAITGGGSVGHDLDSLTGVAATDDLDNLVAGNANGTGTVISLHSHKALWSSQVWSPTAFSYDGKYVAATAIANTDGIAILDARTGHVIASTTLDGTGITLVGGPIFDDSGNLLFVGQQTKDRGQAILRLTSRGKLTRATRVVAVSAYTDNQLAFRFPVGPQ